MKKQSVIKAAMTSAGLRKGQNGRHTYISLLLLVVTILMASCSSDEKEISTSGGGDGVTEKTVNFHIAVPYAAPKDEDGSTPKTRSISETEENTINNIYVLAFKVTTDGNGDILSETYDYSAIATKSGTNVEGTSSQSFTVKVRVKDYKQRFVVITNAEDAVIALTGDHAAWYGADKETMMSNLKVGLATGEDRWNVISASNYTAFPMWGESGAETITGTTTSLSMPIPMLRMIAKINVALDQTITGLTGQFKMKSVHLYNTNIEGHIVPNAVTENTSNGDRYLYVTAPTIPAGATINEGPIEYTDFSSPGITDVAMKGAIYTFETKAPSDGDRMKATCLVVGGLYGTDTNETYYRLDFFESDGTTLRDILRNHQYLVNIISVKGRGHETVDIAYKSKSVNMVAEVLYWNEAGMGNVVFDGQNILSVSKDEFSFTRSKITEEGDNNVLYVLTDYATTAAEGTSGWYTEKIVDAADGTTDVTWVRLTPDNGAANNKTKVILTVDENTLQERSAIIWIAAGRLRYPVTITQSLMQELAINIKDDSGNALSELVFTSKVGVQPAQQTVTVNWVPINADLVVTNIPIGSTPFPTGGGEPQTGTVLAGNNGTGTITYNIKPVAFTTQDIDEVTGDPFLEKVSKVDFVTTNGTSYISASLFLRQTCYNLVTDVVQSGYILNSQNEILKVRANFGWEITAVTDPDDILQNESALVGITGGNNTSEGDPVEFTMAAEVTDGSKTGKTATIIFTSLSDNSTWEVIITANDALYVGYFGGELVQTNGVWQFEKPLYMQYADEMSGSTDTFAWSTDNSVRQGTGDTDGKYNTNLLYNNSYSNPAAELCFKKNNNYASITDLNDANFNWYLPAQKQLMGIWVVYNSFENAYKPNPARYWTSSEVPPSTNTNVSNASYLSFISTETSSSSFSGKLTEYKVRCVR